MTSTTLKKIHNDLYLISWAAGANSSRSTDLEIDNKYRAALKFTDNGSNEVKLELFLRRLPSGVENRLTKENLPDVSASKDGICGNMNLKQLPQGSYDWVWTSSWDCSPRSTQSPATIAASRSHKDVYCSNPYEKFSIEVLIDFKGDSSSCLKKGEKHVLEHLSTLLENQTLADVTFKVGKEVFKAHSNILASGSPVLSAMFTQDFTESRTRVVEIKNTRSQVFKQFLQYIYTGKAEMEQENMARDLLVAADKYGVESLKEECASVLTKNLKVENAIETLILAHLHSIPHLLQESLSFMATRGKAIISRTEDWMYLMKNYPELSFKANQLMMDADCGNKKEKRKRKLDELCESLIEDFQNKKRRRYRR